MITFSNKSIKGKNILLYACNNLQDYITLSLLNVSTDYEDYIIKEYYNNKDKLKNYYTTVRLIKVNVKE